jgi:DNA-binding XRE family transcriptional regulator
MSNFPKAVRELRGLRSQEEFAADLGVHRQTVTVWETGKQLPSIALGRKLVAAGMDPLIVLGAVMDAEDAAA